MTGIIEKLRDPHCFRGDEDGVSADVAEEAAKEIERLRAALMVTKKILVGNIGSDNARIAKALLTVDTCLDNGHQQSTVNSEEGK